MELIVDYPEALVLMVDMDGVMKYIWETSYFLLQGMLERYIGVSGPWKLQISCVT